MHENTQEAWDEIYSEIRNHLDYVVPLYDAIDRNQARQFGSGVLLEISDKHFLITASHVTDHNETSTVYYWGENDLEELEGMAIRTPIPDNGGREDDLLDIAYIPIDPESVNNTFSFLDINQVCPNVGTTEGLFAVTGYPSTKNKTRYTSRKVTRNALSHISTPISEEKYVDLDLDPLKHIAISFDKHNSITEDGRKEPAPDLGGISGGAIWSVSFDSESAEATLGLSGIVTEEVKEEKSIFGTRISFPLEAIRSQNRNLSQHIPSQKDIDVNIKREDV